MADKAPSKEDSRFLGARVEKRFQDTGVVVGKVIGHNPAVKEDQSDERWVVRYTTGKEEALSPQQLLEVLAPDADEPPAGGGSQSAAKGKRKTKGKAKAKAAAKAKATANDPLLGRTVQTWMDLPSGGEAQVRGTIVGVSQKKTGSKKKSSAGPAKY